MRRTALFLALIGSCGAASAASLSSTITVASDYLFDGVSQTQGSSTRDFNPALQASLDLGWDSGFYVGTWASNVDFGDDDPADTEIDIYGGFAKEYESGWGWGLGFATYTYNGAPSDYDYTELSASVTFPTGTEGLFYYTDDDALGGKAWRLKFKHSIDLGNDYSLDLEATRTQYDSDDFTDFSHGQFGVSHPLGPFSAYLGYSDTNQDDNPNADGRVLFTLSTTVDLF